VRWNATRHGINSPAPVVPGLEKAEDWHEHRDGILDNLAPVGRLEVTLAERIALLSWRLHRVTRYETEAIAISQESIEDDIHERDRFLSVLRHKGLESTHPEVIRFEAKYYRQVQNALRRFPLLGPEKVLKGPDASSVVWSVLMEAKKAKGKDIDRKVLDLPGVPEDAAVEELSAMNAAEVTPCRNYLINRFGPLGRRPLWWHGRRRNGAFGPVLGSLKRPQRPSVEIIRQFLYALE
jgi:hypothetical protein